MPVLVGFRRDIVFSVRLFCRSPSLAATVLLSLALGIGANIAVFGIIDALFFGSLPVKHPERLVAVDASNLAGENLDLTYADYLRLSSTNVFTDVAACSDISIPSVRTHRSGAEISVSGELVSPNYFSVLGLAIERGQTLSVTQDTGVVVSTRLWNRLFPQSTGVLGAPLLLNNNVPVFVIGVAPAKFLGDSPERVTDIWLPITLQPRLGSEDWLHASWIGWVDCLRV